MKEILIIISDTIVPLTIIGIVTYGLLLKVPVYDTFIKGAKKGFHTVFSILPTLIGLMVAVGILRASGFLEWLGKCLGTVTNYCGFPGELLPLSLVKMFSSSAATGLLLDIYNEYGVDSVLGLTASIMMSSTETIFYTVSLYYMTAKVTKTRWTITGAVLCSIVGIIVSVVLGQI